MTFKPWLASLALLTAPALAQAESPQWTLQVDPLTTALGFVHLQVERAISPDFSIYAGPHARLFDSLLDDKDEPYKGYGLEVGLRWFFLGGAPEGWWAQVRGVGAHLSTDDGDETALGGYVSALAGYTAIFADRWVLSGGAGGQYLHYRVAGLGPKRFFLALHTTVGVAF